MEPRENLTPNQGCEALTEVPSGGTVTTTHDVLRQVNEATGDRWQLIRPLSGGHQSGATEVMAGDRRAVLKWAPDLRWAPRVLGAAEVVVFARRHGYPTPAWLTWGTTQEGYPYLLYDYLPGQAPSVLGRREAEAHLNLIERQVAMSPPTPVNWSDYMTGSVFEDRQGDQARLAALDGGRARRGRHRVDHRVFQNRMAHADMDLVHGDMSLGNLIFDDGTLSGVVDIEALGCGTAAYDLMAGIRSAYLFPSEVEEEALAMLEQAAVQMFDGAVVLVCVAIQIVEMLNFGLTRWPERLQEVASRALGWLDSTRRLVGG
jgi:aminoglycoside phosphotransferase (APT) family kinase protein